MIKNKFRILKKPHAYLQTILKAPVKFQKDRTKTVEGVKGTRYLLKSWYHAPQKAKNSVPPLFFEKAGDNNYVTRQSAYISGPVLQPLLKGSHYLPKYYNTTEILEYPWKILVLVNWEILCQHRKRESILNAKNLQIVFEVLSLKILLIVR